MFKMKVNPNNRRATIHIRKLIGNQRQGIRMGLYFLGKDLVRETRREILEKPKHGTVYHLKRKGRVVRHQASSPGEPPSNFSGTLRKSIDFNVTGYDEMEFGSRNNFPNRKGVPDGAKYGKYLELGTKNMARRPYLISSIKKNQANARKHFEREIEKALKQ